MSRLFRGVFAIPVTPFDRHGAVDEAALRRVVAFTLACGAHGLVAPVNASEFSSLSDAERQRVAEIVVEEAAGRVPVVIGVSGVSTEVAVQFTRHARAIGADAIIALPPYVRRASPEEISAYYAALARAFAGPVFIQNCLPPVGTPLSADLLARLVRDLDHVQYIKEETLPPGQMITRVRELAGPALQGVMGGLAGKFLLDEYRRGACGTMPACEVVDIHVQIWEALEAGDWARARALHTRLLPLLVFESNFGVAAYKEVLRRRGVLECTYVRAPGTPRLDAYDQAELQAILEDLAPLFRQPAPHPA